MRRRRCLGLLATLASLSGCSDETRVTTPERVARTDGGAVALSRDERVAVVANRSAGVVTVLSLNPALGAANMVTGKVELDMGEGSEPWAAVTGADDDTAYVVLRKSRTVVRINSLRDQPTLDPSTVSVGSEPSDIAISPSGEMLFVSSWAEGTIQMIATAGMVPGAEISLNDVLAKSGLLGSLDPRPALAHPYALAITDDGDDDDYDETLYATEFFSQPLYGVEQDADFGYLDRNRQGLVYSVDLATGQTGPLIQLAPFQQTGFVDGEGRMTGCFPNQLYGAAVHDGHLYVTSMCTSPRGPLGPRGSNMQPTAQNFKTLFHPAVFVVDIASGQELPGASRLLTRQLSDYYDAGEEDSQARMPLIPNDIAFRAREDGETANAYVTALGADAVFRLDYDAGGTLLGIGSPGARYIDTGRVSSLPVGVAVSRSSSPPFALVALDAVQRVSVIDLASERVTVVGAVDQTEHALVHLESPENVGRRLFVTGRDVWSYKGQAWGSCESCHPGGLSDGVVWSFSRGPRRTLSAASAYDKASAPSERMRRLMLWGANIDEVHDIEGIVRSVTGGVGAVLWSYASQPSNDCRLLFDGSQPVEGGSLPCRIAKRTTHLHNGLNGALAPIVTGKGCASDASECNESGAPDWNYIDAYIRWQRVPRAPVGLSTAAVQAGRELFARHGARAATPERTGAFPRCSTPRAPRKTEFCPTSSRPRCRRSAGCSRARIRSIRLSCLSTRLRPRAARPSGPSRRRRPPTPLPSTSCTTPRTGAMISCSAPCATSGRFPRSPRTLRCCKARRRKGRRSRSRCART